MKEIERLFDIDVPTGKPSVGAFLVAEPFLKEYFFNHAIITLLDYSEEKGAMGLVLNRETDETLGKLIPSLRNADDVPVYLGGPVDRDRLFYLHRVPQLIHDSAPLGNGLWGGGSFDDVKAYLEEDLPVEGNIRFFAGCSGWDRDQLESEIERHVWAIVNPESAVNLLEGGEDAYWHKFISQLGPQYNMWRYHPMNPSSN